MHLTQKLTLCAATRTGANTPAIPFLWTSSSSTRSGIATVSTSGASSTSSAIPQSASQTNGNGDVNDKSTTSIPTVGLKPSDVILDEAIPFLNAFSILGRLVANVKCPLQEYTPSQVIPYAEIPGLDKYPIMLASNYNSLTRQSTSASEASIASSSSSNSSGASSSRTLVDDEDAGDEADFARELGKYKTSLIFSNLPFTISSSTTATVTHSSRCSTRTNSFLTAMLGISISSSTVSTTTYRLDSALIRTLSLSQHHLVWAALLGHDEYKKDIMTAAQRNGGKMFLVIGVKMARDAEVQKEVSRGRTLGGGLQVDVGDGVGVQGLGKAAVGKDGVGASMGLGGSLVREVMDERGRKGRLLGDRVFAIEYREVKLKLKLQIGGSRKKDDKRGRERKKARNSPPRDTAELQKWLQKQYGFQPETMMAPHLLQTFSLPYPLTGSEIHNFKPSADEYWDREMCAVDEIYRSDSDDSTEGGCEHHTDTDGSGDDEYELELGEEVYVEEADAL